MRIAFLLLESLLKIVPCRRFLGHWGELFCACMLAEKGYTIRARNWSCTLGELDIIAVEGRTLVFCEVKTRHWKTAGRHDPLRDVSPEKLEKIYRLARHYCRCEALALKRGKIGEFRIDLLGVYAQGIRTRVVHLRGTTEKIRRGGKTTL